jgi:uroporphyrinogen decarboxylase
MLYEDKDLVKEIIDNIGSRLVKHYEILGGFDAVGAMISNDDWGYKTQPMLTPAQMREYIIPWHKKIVQAIHNAGRPAILHSCGNLELVMDDIIDDIGFDGKHSYEDVICPVEEMYDRYHDRIAILGGIDVDFLCRSTPEEITKRSRALVEMGMRGGGYALGSGNSIPEYVPQENYLAMIKAAID